MDDEKGQISLEAADDNDTSVEVTSNKNNIDVDEDVKEEGQNSDDDLVDYKEKYRNLKRKLKCLLFEQECFHEELRKVQRKCLRVKRDKSFLLDHLLKYEDPEDSSSDGDSTESSNTDEEQHKERSKKVKMKESSSSSKDGSKSDELKSKNNIIAADKVRCRKMEKGKQCAKLVSIKVKSGICYAHRQQMALEKQAAPAKVSTSPAKSPKPASTQPVKRNGGKDISQIREAMEASSQISSEMEISGLTEEEDDLVIDVPQ